MRSDWPEFYGILICLWLVVTFLLIYEIGGDE